ncbi:Hepatocyte growth factor-regulated tyrosine kinase substrate [Fasciola hepatica]|uniref:Hepatocyte growth factor-regulated tyrosine kinase substrate n=1 Tax=Fasciola hepatica TaxID=6192 RepID=A0A4E0REU2_FASHE|nr:Hepatocyte growth factor-regulated tyrosine kinase substrate [Fasciola hepatica]
MDMLKRSRVDKLVEKATNELLIEPDIETTLTICDLVRGQEISAKHVIASVKRRLTTDNANVILHTLYVIESLMKNCGAAVHEEVATRDFMQIFISLVNVLTSVQNWAFVFKGKQEYSAIQEAYDELKADGHTFPRFSENDAMFSVVCAPNWKEESYCHRCKVAFTTFRRRHHCRHCGNSFCAECSSERAVLPKFGIEKEVRVCDHCFDLLTRNPAPETTAKEKKPQSNKDEQARREKERRERDLQTQEAEELALALALSASEAECKERERHGFGSNTLSAETNPSGYPNLRSENGPMQLLPVLDTSDMDPELARYLNRHYWENRANALGQQNLSKPCQDSVSTSPVPQPSAPRYLSPVSATIPSPVSTLKNDSVAKPSSETEHENNPASCNSHPPGVPKLTTQKQEEFLSALRASIEFFVNRMQSDSQRGRSIANDTTVQALFLTLHEMHPQLLQQKQAMEDRRAYFEGLQDKLTQIREAREALDALRLEHSARRQLEEQEAARIRQLQMMQKLEVMRQQKRDTLEYKRRMALEQTMQYQQQYQSQTQSVLHHSVDPTTGLPLSVPMSHVHPPTYSVSSLCYPNLVSMQPPYLTTTTASSTYGTIPTETVTGGYGQPGASVSDGPNYYPATQMPIVSQTQPPGQVYYAQQQVGPTPTQTQHPAFNAGAYSMQALDAALPSVATHQPDPRSNVYPGQQNFPGTHSQQSMIHEPNVYTHQQVFADLPEPPNTEIRAASPSQSGYAQSQTAQRDPNEGQLISFD